MYIYIYIYSVYIFIKEVRDYIRRYLLVIYFAFLTCQNQCCKFKKNFNLISSADDEIFYSFSDDEQTLDYNADPKNGKSDSEIPKLIEHKENNSYFGSSDQNRLVKHLHPNQSSCSSNVCSNIYYIKVQDQPKYNQRHPKQISEQYFKSTYDNTRIHDSEKHQRYTDATRIIRPKHKEMRMRRIFPKVRTSPLINNKFKTTLDCQRGNTKPSNDVHLQSPKNHSGSTFSQHHSSKFSASNRKDHGSQPITSQGTSSFVHQPLHCSSDSSESLPPLYGHSNFNTTTSQPKISHSVQPSCNILPRMQKESIKSANHSSHPSKHDNVQPNLSHHPECHLYAKPQVGKSQCAFGPQINSLNCFVHPSENQHDRVFVETSTTSLSSLPLESQHNKIYVETSTASLSCSTCHEEISDVQMLHHSASVSGCLKPHSYEGEEYYSPLESDGNNGDDNFHNDEMMVDENFMFTPIESLEPATITSNSNNLSLTEGYDLINLSSSTSQEGGGGSLDSLLGALSFPN